MPPTDGRWELRLADLSHAELLRVAAIGCGESRAAMAEANRMLSAANPLPTWAVDQVLLSPDLLPKLLSICVRWNKGGAPANDGLQDRAAAAVCRAWRDAWARQLDEERICRVLGTLCDGLEFMSPTGGAALSDVSFCVASHSLGGSTLDIVTRPPQHPHPHTSPHPNPDSNPKQAAQTLAVTLTLPLPLTLSRPLKDPHPNPNPDPRPRAPGSDCPKRPAGPDRLTQAASDPEEWPFVLECDGRHLYVTDNRRQRISKRSLQGDEVRGSRGRGAARAHAHMHVHMHMHTCLRECARTVQVSFATLPEVLEHAAGAIHLAIGTGARAEDELFVSQVVRSP